MTRPTRVHGDSGTATVEIAIVLPLLVMLLFGIYAVSRAYNAKTELTAGVREAARAVALRQTAEGYTGGATLPTTASVVTASSPGLSPAPTVQVVKNCQTLATATDADVKATYTMTYSIPFVREGTWTITAEGVMRCGL